MKLASRGLKLLGSPQLCDTSTDPFCRAWPRVTISWESRADISIEHHGFRSPASMSSQTRTFLALPLPADIVTALGRLRRRIEPEAGGLRRVEPANCM